MLISPRAPMNVQKVPNSPVSDDTAQYSALSSCASFSASCSIWEYWAGDWQRKTRLLSIKPSLLLLNLSDVVQKRGQYDWKFRLLLFFIQSEGFSSGEGGGISLWKVNLYSLQLQDGDRGQHSWGLRRPLLNQTPDTRLQKQTRTHSSQRPR